MHDILFCPIFSVTCQEEHWRLLKIKYVPSAGFSSPLTCCQRTGTSKCPSDGRYA